MQEKTKGGRGKRERGEACTQLLDVKSKWYALAGVL